MTELGNMYVYTHVHAHIYLFLYVSMYTENYEVIVISLILNQLQRIHQLFLLWQWKTLLPLSSIYLFEHSLHVISHHYHPLTTPAYTDTFLTLSGPDTSCQIALLYKCSLYPTWTPIPSARVPLPPPHLTWALMPCTVTLSYDCASYFAQALTPVARPTTPSCVFSPHPAWTLTPQAGLPPCVEEAKWQWVHGKIK